MSIANAAVSWDFLTCPNSGRVGTKFAFLTTIPSSYSACIKSSLTSLDDLIPTRSTASSVVLDALCSPLCRPGSKGAVYGCPCKRVLSWKEHTPPLQAAEHPQLQREMPHDDALFVFGTMIHAWTVPQYLSSNSTLIVEDPSLYVYVLLVISGEDWLLLHRNQFTMNGFESSWGQSPSLSRLKSSCGREALHSAQQRKIGPLR